MSKRGALVVAAALLPAGVAAGEFDKEAAVGREIMIALYVIAAAVAAAVVVIAGVCYCRSRLHVVAVGPAQPLLGAATNASSGPVPTQVLSA